jgi:hypothetical protein
MFLACATPSSFPSSSPRRPLPNLSRREPERRERRRRGRDAGPPPLQSVVDLTVPSPGRRERCDGLLRWAAPARGSAPLATGSAGMRGQWLSAERRASSGKPSFEQGKEGKLGEAELRAGVGGGCELVEEGRHRRRTPGRGAAHRRLRRREQGDVLLCCTAAALQGRRQDRTR